MILLYEKLLDAATGEKDAVARCNIDEIEHYCSLKEGLVKELEDMRSSGKMPVLSPRQKDEIESLIRKIIEINAGNASAVGNIRDEVITEISGLRKRKAAFKAYRSCA